jgi:hypothetical protein
MVTTLHTALDELKRRYCEQLRQAAATNSNTVIGNRFPWQTRLALETLLRKAIQDVAPIRMFCGGMPSKFYEDGFVTLMDNYLALPGSSMRVAVWHDDVRVIAPRMRDLGSKYKSFQLRWSATRASAELLPHFFLVGESAYRQEMPHGDFKDQEFSEVTPEIPAAICFNDPAGGKSQGDFFEKVWVMCKPVAV